MGASVGPGSGWPRIGLLIKKLGPDFAYTKKTFLVLVFVSKSLSSDRSVLFCFALSEEKGRRKKKAGEIAMKFPFNGLCLFYLLLLSSSLHHLARAEVIPLTADTFSDKVFSTPLLVIFLSLPSFFHPMSLCCTHTQSTFQSKLGMGKLWNPTPVKHPDEEIGIWNPGLA